MKNQNRNFYDATIMAAETIRAKPEWFSFASVSKPDFCGTPGCAIGWINVFAGIPTADLGDRRVYGTHFCDVVGVIYDGPKFNADSKFYNEMDELSKPGTFVANWCNDANTCADTLLRWAERHRETLSAHTVETVT